MHIKLSAGTSPDPCRSTQACSADLGVTLDCIAAASASRQSTGMVKTNLLRTHLHIYILQADAASATKAPDIQAQSSSGSPQPGFQLWIIPTRNSCRRQALTSADGTMDDCCSCFAMCSLACRTKQHGSCSCTQWHSAWISQSGSQQLTRGESASCMPWAEEMASRSELAMALKMPASGWPCI